LYPHCVPLLAGELSSESERARRGTRGPRQGDALKRSKYLLWSKEETYLWGDLHVEYTTKIWRRVYVRIHAIQAFLL
jgi:hypothetical protein